MHDYIIAPDYSLWHAAFVSLEKGNMLNNWSSSTPLSKSTSWEGLCGLVLTCQTWESTGVTNNINNYFDSLPAAGDLIETEPSSVG